ncbi:hypothetical protein JW911_00235 [Candidatus Peregrinibacteria bacterium]|nr:hypothetical protein [Candidatus Peregrinibacteria bacterium]
MIKIFFENRLVYKHFERNNLRDDERMKENYAKSLINGDIDDSKTAENINKRLHELRTDLQGTSIFSEEDRKSWKSKINILENQPDEYALKRFEEEFAMEKRSIQGMVDKYTQKVLDNKKTAFTTDESRKIDTASEYLDWFSKLSKAEKEKALNKIDQDINDRIKLRQEIIKKNPGLKVEVVKMRRSEMHDKLKELEKIEKNVEKARRLLERDKKYSSGYEYQLRHFADMPPEKQERYLLGYEQYYLKPRKEVADKYESLPAGIRNHPELPGDLKKDFNNLKLKEKQQYLERMEDFIEAKYEETINNLPEDVWSKATKRFAKNWFMQSPDLKTKAERLDKIHVYIEKEEKLRDEYLHIDQNIRNMNDYSLRTWEKSDGIQKEKLLRLMKQEASMYKLFEGQLLTQLRNKTISASSYVKLLKDYTEGSFQFRQESNRDFYNNMAPRKQLLEDFNTLSEETKKHFQASFLIHGYLNRLKIFNEALDFEKKNIKKENTQNASVKDKPTIANKEPVLSVQEKEELEKLDILEDIVEDQEDIVLKEGGKENLEDQEKQFGDDKFTKDLNEKVITKSGGKKMLGKDGKIDKVEKIDISRFGQDKDNQLKVAKHLREMAQNENYREVRITDENGRILTTKEAKSKFAQRKNTLVGKFGLRQKLNKQKAEKLIDEEFKKAA